MAISKTAQSTAGAVTGAVRRTIEAEEKMQTPRRAADRDPGPAVQELTASQRQAQIYSMNASWRVPETAPPVPFFFGDGVLAGSPAEETLPQVQSVQRENAPTRALTPAQRTDAAYAGYQAALAQRERALAEAPHNRSQREEIKREQDAAVAAAKHALDEAVAAEIGARVDAANAGVPSEYQRPLGELVTSYGNAILRRHADDPAAQAALTESIDDYKLQRQAEALIPGGDASSQVQLTVLGHALAGKPPELVERVLADPRVQRWIEEAAAHIAEPYEGVGDSDLASAHDEALEASKRLAETVENLPPELAAQVIAQSMPTIERIAQLNPHGNPLPFERVYDAMSKLGDGAQARTLMNRVAREFVANPDFDSTVLIGYGGAIHVAAGRTHDVSFAVAIADQLRAAGREHEAELVLDAAALGIREFLSHDVNSPLKKFNEAHQAAQEKDQHLAELLAKAGPLTDEQMAAFIQAYRNDPENRAVYQAEADAAKALAGHLDANQEALLFAAGRSPEAAQQLYDSLKALMDVGQGRTALEFALAIQSDPSSAVARAFDKFGDFKTEFTEQAIAAGASQLLADHNGDPQAAFDELEALFDRYKPDWATSGLAGLKEGFEAVRQAKDGRYDRLNHISANFDKAGPVLKGLAAVAIIFGAVSGANAANRGDYAEAVNRFAMAGSGSAKLLAAVTKNLADVGKLAAYGDTALSFPRFSAKLAPGLAIVANATAAASDGGKLLDGDMSYAVSFIGDVLGVLGGALEFTVVGAPLGLLVQAAGALVQIAGSIVTGNAEEEAFQAEQAKYLEAAGIGNSGTREALIHSDPEQVQQWLALGLTPSQLQALAARYPNVLQSSHGLGFGLGYLPGLMERTGLDGQQLYDMLMAADQGDTPGTGMEYVLGALSNLANAHGEIVDAQSRSELIAAFEAEAAQTDNPDQTRAMTQAAQWLRSH